MMLTTKPETPDLIVSIMGDGLPGFSAVQTELKKVGTQLQIIPYSAGKSFGEDKLMGPKEWLDNPKLALGKTVACYLRDGDQNIALKWCNSKLRAAPFIGTGLFASLRASDTGSIA